MDEALQKVLNEFSTTILTLVVTVLVPYGLNMLRTWIKAKIASIEDATIRQRVEYALERLDHIVKNTVDEVSQAYAAQTDLTEDDKKLRLRTAYTRIQNQLPAKTKEILSGAVKDLDRYIITKIEANRWKQKQAPGDRAAESIRFEKAIEKAQERQATCK